MKIVRHLLGNAVHEHFDGFAVSYQVVIIQYKDKVFGDVFVTVVDDGINYCIQVQLILVDVLQRSKRRSAKSRVTIGN